MSVQRADGAAKGGRGVECRTREGARSSIAAGPRFAALLNPAGRLAAVSAGAHAAPRGGTDTLRGAASSRALGGLHLQLRASPPWGGKRLRPTRIQLYLPRSLPRFAGAESWRRPRSPACASTRTPPGLPIRVSWAVGAGWVGAGVPASSECERRPPRGRQREQRTTHYLPPCP